MLKTYFNKLVQIKNFFFEKILAPETKRIPYKIIKSCTVETSWLVFFVEPTQTFLHDLLEIRMIKQKRT